MILVGWKTKKKEKKRTCMDRGKKTQKMDGWMDEWEMKKKDE